MATAVSNTVKQSMSENGRQHAEAIEGAFIWLAYHAFPILFVFGFASLTERVFKTNESFNYWLMFLQSLVLELGAIGFVFAGMENKIQGKKRSAKWYLVAGLSITALTLLSVAFNNLPTIVDQATVLKDYKEPVKQISDTAEALLLFIRSAASLLYGFVEHILRGIASDELATRTPQQQQREDALLQQISTLHTLVQEMQRKLDAVPPPEKIDYQMIANQISSVIAKPEQVQQEEDKLDKAVEILRGNAHVTDEDLATLLNLRRPASARFWRLRAKEILEIEQNSSVQDDLLPQVTIIEEPTRTPLPTGSVEPLPPTIQEVVREAKRGFSALLQSVPVLPANVVDERITQPTIPVVHPLIVPVEEKKDSLYVPPQYAKSVRAQATSVQSGQQKVYTGTAKNGTPESVRDTVQRTPKTVRTGTAKNEQDSTLKNARKDTNRTPESVRKSVPGQAVQDSVNDRLKRGYEEMKAKNMNLSGRQLGLYTNINKNTACAWYKENVQSNEDRENEDVRDVINQ